MGLLTKINDKKISLRNQIVIPDHSEAIIKKKNRIADFLVSSSSLKVGFEYSNNILKLYSKFMDFNKGALLVLEDANNTFIPASSLNIDITTIRHLRIQYSILSTMIDNYFKIINKNNNIIKVFKHYFSIREFSALNSIAIVPFYINGIIQSILLIIDPTKETLELCKDVSLKSEKIILKLFKSRKPFSSNQNKEVELNHSDPFLILDKLIEEINFSDKFNLLLISINFNSLKNTLMGYLPNVESYEISNNIFKAITKLISPSGEIYKINSEKCILFYRIKKGKSSKIILHQINLAISTFFNLTETLPAIETIIKEFSNNNLSKADTILDGLI